MARTKRAIVSVTNDLYTDQRVHKVCLFIQSQGYDVLLVGRKKRNSLALLDRPYKTKRLKLLFEKGPLFYAFFNLRLFLFLLVRKSAVLVSNDLDTLLANSFAKKFKRNASLVYDSHEYFTQVPELVNRPRIQKIWTKIERKIFPRLDKIYTVNQSIAQIYGGLYSKELLVVRNISPHWKAEDLASKKELGIPENQRLIILQGAGINVDRGAEEAVEAMLQIEAVLMIVGDGDVIPSLKLRVSELKLENRVIFYGKKAYHEMMNYTHYAEIGLTLDKPTNMNYKYSLPNKVFDYMHAFTPIVATNIKEVATVINENKIGEIVADFNVDSLAECINSLLNDNDRLNNYNENCQSASLVLNWEEEVKKLKTIYPSLE